MRSERLHGYIDPEVKAGTGKERELLAAIRQRGLSLHRLHRDGTAVRVTGPGVFVVAASLGAIALADLTVTDPVVVRRLHAGYERGA